MVGVVLGRRGSGKTYLTKTRIVPLLKRPVFILEAAPEYGSGVVFHSVTDCAEWIDRFPDRVGDLVALLRVKTVESIEATFDLANQVGGSIVVEEAWRFSSPSSQLECIKQCLLFGRHLAAGDGIDLVLISQRAARLNRDATSQADWIVSFRQEEPRDLAYLRERASSADKAATLGKYDYLIIGELPEEWENSSRCLDKSKIIA